MSWRCANTCHVSCVRLHMQSSVQEQRLLGGLPPSSLPPPPSYRDAGLVATAGYPAPQLLAPALVLAPGPQRQNLIKSQDTHLAKSNPS